MDRFVNRGLPPFLGPPFARDSGGGGDGDFARDGGGDGDFARDGGGDGDFARGGGDGDFARGGGGGDGDFAGPPFACGDAADAADDADESLSSSLLS